MINFGKYDQKVSFISFQSVSDGAGGTVPTPLTILTTFASVVQTNGGNAIESSEMVLPNTYQISIQYRTSFVPNESYQVLYASKYYKILGVLVREQRQHKEYILTIVGIQ
jgi:SPP1 family predicted phage head-tail adaptor